MRFEKCRAMPIDGRVFVIELGVAGIHVWVVGVLIEAEHEVPFRFDPVDAIVFVVNNGRIREPDFQSCAVRIVGSPRDVVGATSAITYRGHRRDGQ